LFDVFGTMSGGGGALSLPGNDKQGVSCDEVDKPVLKMVCGMPTGSETTCKSFSVGRDGLCRLHKRSRSPIVIETSDEMCDSMSDSMSDDNVVDSDDQHKDFVSMTDEYIRLHQQQYIPSDDGSALVLDQAFRKTLEADIEVLKMDIKTAFEVGTYNFEKPRFYEKLVWFVDMLCSCEEVTIVLQIPRIEVSILPVKRVLIHDPAAFNTKVRSMIVNERTGLWRSGPKNPTWPIYEFFRTMGMKPRFRGGEYSDPGKADMLYYKMWTFTNDVSFVPIVNR